MNRILYAAAISFLFASAHAQITVTGISPRTTSADRASFTIATSAGYSYAATLNGFTVDVGVPVTVTNANYYELRIQRTATTGVPTTEDLFVPFIIRSSERGSSETGLPPWTPLPNIPSAAPEFAGAHVELLAPSNYPAGMAVPLVAWIRDENGRRGVNASIRPENRPELVIRRGVGSVLLTNFPGQAVLDYEISLPHLSTNARINLDADTVWTTHNDTVSSNMTWAANSRIRVQSLTIPAGVTLTIDEGSVLQIAPGAEIIVAGTLRANGTMRNPVVFAPDNQAQPWGGIELRTAAARLELTGAILTGGGADGDWFDTSGNGSSHRDEQPILYASNAARVTVTDSALIWGAGQAGHGENGFFDFTRTLIQGFITAGQYNSGSVTFVDGAAIEFPRDDGQFADVDNDGFYLTGGAHFLTNSLIGWARDDGVDSGSGSAGSVTVVNCWVESCFHEGLAWSEDRTASVIDTVVLNCGQGIETGFGSPDVFISNSLSTGNVIGARFGDNYDWDYEGFLRVTNSLFLHNYRDVFGFTWDDWTYRSNQMDIRASYFTQANRNHPFNALWQPEFDASVLLGFLPSPAATVGAGLGLRAPRILTDSTNLPVRLSTFTTNSVTIDYLVQTKTSSTTHSNLAGSLTFSPGQTVQHISILRDRLPTDAEIVQVSLTAASNAELSGLTRGYLIPEEPAAFEVVVPFGSTWKYPDPSTNLGNAWRTAGFDDSAWRRGAGELGGGEGDEATAINIGEPSRFPTIYFRHLFVLPAAPTNETFTANLKVDDGAIVYLNGQEMFRANMPAGTVSYSTLAPSTRENDFFSNSIPASDFVAGTNLLAVEVHQQGPNSSDLSFDFELRKTLPLELRTFSFGDHLVLNWPGPNTILEEAPTLAGPWTALQTGGDAIEIAATYRARFYRLRQL